ncbi:MAG TPA: response regulator [Chitinophagaceae bacterium]|jgi:CheY-like chemotaxis protein
MTKEILLIDDDDDEFEVFDEALHSIDKAIHCTRAKDMEDALEFLGSSSPAYIFIDFNMPKKNGLECLSEIKKIKKLENTKVVLYSNHVDDQMTQKALALGAFRCLKKPNMINLLARRLKEILTA